MRFLPFIFLFTDIGLVLYWVLTLGHFIPESYLFKDNHNPLLMIWYWSFLPLDLLVVATGFTALFFKRYKDDSWTTWAIVSLTITFGTGLQALIFWYLKNEFDPVWCIPNLYLTLYPIYFIHQLSKDDPARK
jgi:Ni,Fe-hydrogenase I cytochrome b subunit